MSAAVICESRTQQRIGCVTLSLEQTKLINNASHYLNVPICVLEFSLNQISRSAAILWQKIKALSGKSKDWSICISNKQLGEYVGRSAHTIYVQLKELVNAGLIEKESRSGKSNLLKVRFPTSIQKEKIVIRKKPDYQTPFIFEGGRKVRSLYINNNIYNNNYSSKDLVKEPPQLTSEIVVDRNLIKLEAEQSMPTQEIEKYEKMLLSVQSEILEICKESGQDAKKATDNFQKLNGLYEQETKLKLLLSREKSQNLVKKQIKPEKLNYIAKSGDRSLSAIDRIRLNKLSPDLANEIAYAVRFGSLIRSKYGGEMSTSQGIDIAFKLLREKKWTQPRGMQQ